MIGQLIGGVIAIVIGIIAVIKLLVEVKLVVSALSLSFGVTALIWVLRARRSLSKGSSLKALTTHFLATVVFILCFSFWGIAVEMLSLEAMYGESVILPQYLFISLAYITFAGAAYKIRSLGKEFGFNLKSEEIAKILKEKKKKKK
ncbi:MAG: hypothetical protein KKA79_04055 [Nanoarchaeota archaeon]|nr:hypothetical protein [Nanoarchaeota archaeon]MCG2718296.1 hypothetical protein [Nanoarchaeota archaeon]